MPSRLRVRNTFGERPVEPESKQAKSVYLISIAGEGKTEEQYFDGLYDLETTKDLIKIERLEKIDETDTKSHPNHVINLLDERKEKWQAHGIEPNELWMVIDRDKQNVSEKQLKAVIDRCKKEKYNFRTTDLRKAVFSIMA